jgi:hypothetical protein
LGLRGELASVAVTMVAVLIMAALKRGRVRASKHLRRTAMEYSANWDVDVAMDENTI